MIVRLVFISCVAPAALAALGKIEERIEFRNKKTQLPGNCLEAGFFLFVVLIAISVLASLQHPAQFPADRNQVGLLLYHPGTIFVDRWYRAHLFPDCTRLQPFDLFEWA